MILIASNYCRTSLYRKAQSISATKPSKYEEAIVIGLLRPDRGVCWNRVFAHSLLYGCGITWMMMGEAKMQMLGKNTKNPAKHIKQLYPSIN